MPQKGDPVRGLPEQVFEIDFSKGLSEHEDEWLQVEGFTQLHNCFQDKAGAVVKLPGYDNFGQGARNLTGESFPTEDLTGPSKLFARGKQIGALDNGRVYAKADQWILQGRASPWVAEQRTVIELEPTSVRIDCCRSGDWSFTVWEVDAATDYLRVSATYLPTGETVVLTEGAGSYSGAELAKPRIVPLNNTGKAVLCYLNGSATLHYRIVSPAGLQAQQTLETVAYNLYDVWSDPTNGFMWAFFCTNDAGGEGDATFTVRRYTLGEPSLAGGPSTTITIPLDVSWPTPPAMALYGSHSENRVVAAWVEAEDVGGDPTEYQAQIRAICFQSDPSAAVVWSERTIFDDWEPVAGDIPAEDHVNQLAVVSLGASGHYFVWSDVNSAYPGTPGTTSEERRVVRGKRVTIAGVVDAEICHCGYVCLRSRPAWDGTRVFFLAEYVFRGDQDRQQRHHYILGIEPVLAAPLDRRFRPLGHFSYVTAGIDLSLSEEDRLLAGLQRMSTPFQDADGGWHFQAIELWAEGISRHAIREYTLFADERVGVAAELGNQTYLAGALLSAWDGLRALEAGFLHEPWIEEAVNPAGSLPAGTYFYKLTYARYSASGEVTRSAPSTELEFVADGSDACRISTQSNTITNQMDADKRPAFLEIWRTRANETAPFYLLRRSEMDPHSRSVITHDDNASDSALGLEQLYSEGSSGELANHPPTAALSVCLWRNRLLITDGEQVLYSKEGVSNRGAEFSRLQAIQRATRQKLTAVAPLGEIFAVFGEDETGFVYGDGPAATGLGSTLVGPSIIADPLGCTQPAGLCVMPGGLLVPTRHGLRFLSLGREYSYIGAGIERVTDVYPIVRDARICRAPLLVGATKQLHGDLLWVLLATSGRTQGQFAIFDLLHKTWATAFTSAGDSTLPQTLVAVGDEQFWLAEDATGHVRSDSYLLNTDEYAETIELPWIKPAGPNGEIRAKRFWLLAEWAGATYGLRVEIDYDFHEDNTYTRDFTGAELEDGEGQLVRLRMPFPRQRCQAFRLRFTALPPATSVDGFRFVSLRVAVAQRRTNGRLLPARNTGGPFT